MLVDDAAKPPPAAAAKPPPAAAAETTAASGADADVSTEAPAKPKLTSAQFAALRRAQKENKRLSSEREQLAAYRGQADQELAQLRARVQESAAQLDAIKANPIAWAASNGVDPNVAIRKFVGEGTPEAQIAAALEESKQARAELKAYRDEMDRKERERGEAAARQQEQQIRENVYQAIVTNRKEWPYTNAAMSESEIRAKLVEIHEIGIKRKESYTLQSVREAFEGYAKRRWQQMQEAAKELLAPPESSTEGQATTVSPTAQRAGIRSTAAAKQPPTTASTPATPRRRAPLSRKEQEAADLAALRAAMAADKAKRLAGRPANPAKPAPAARSIRH